MFLQCFRFPELNQWKTHKHVRVGGADEGSVIWCLTKLGDTYLTEQNQLGCSRGLYTL